MRSCNICSTGSENLFYRSFLNFDSEFIQDGVLGSNHTLVYAELFCPASTFLCFLIVDIQNVHGSITDICKKICSFEVSELIYNSRISLWIKTTSNKVNVIIFIVEAVMNFRILKQIGAEIFMLIPYPCQRKSSRQMNICFTNGKDIQFSCNSHEG